MRHGGMMVLMAAAGLSLGSARADDTQGKANQPAKTAVNVLPAKAPSAVRAVTPSTVISLPPAATPVDSPLVRAAKAAVAARLRDPKGRIVINSATLVRGPRLTATSTAPGAALPASAPGRSWATGNSVDASAVAAGERAQRADRDAAERARQDALRNEQARMAEQSDEPYPTDVDEDQVVERLTKIPDEIKNPPL